MDDFDDLLDEVESKFCGRGSGGGSTNVKRVSSRNFPSSNRKPESKTSDLDDIINDIIADDGLNDVLKSNSTNLQPKKPPSSSSITTGSNKCFTVCLGGTSNATGNTTASQRKSCDHLHCTSCDNKIVVFDNYKWSPTDLEYLIFRNNYPDFDRLKSKLIPRKGYRAFCCQCCWVDVRDITELKSIKPSFKWICKKH